VNDEAARQGRPATATTYHLEPILPRAPVGITPLQIWVRALLDLLADARHGLDDREFATILDIALIRIVHELIALGLDEWRGAA
jgi:hypothetical protein